MATELIGIAGPSGSGKTSLARRLGSVLGPTTLVVALDAYYRDLAHLDPAVRAAHDFDRPDAIDRDLLVEQFGALAAGGSVEIPIYRFTDHTRAANGRRVGPADCVVVEGLFALYWIEVRRLLRWKLFVDAADTVCLARRLERDVQERGRDPRSVRHQYESTVRPMYRRYVEPTRRFADLVLDGSQSVDELVDDVRGLLAGPPVRKEP